MKHLPFDHFKGIVEIAVHFADSLDLEEIDEIMNDWYALYKGMNYEHPVEFLRFHLPPKEVNRNTHDFWLDPTGLMVLMHHDRIQF